MGNYIDSIFQGLITSAIYSIILWSISKARVRLSYLREWRIHFSPVNRLLTLIVGALLVCCALIYLTGNLVAGLLFAVVTIGTHSATLVMSAGNVGLYGVDKHVEKGFDYDASLLLCENALDFLGTGAGKLTDSQYFEGRYAGAIGLIDLYAFC